LGPGVAEEKRSRRGNASAAHTHRRPSPTGWPKPKNVHWTFFDGLSRRPPRLFELGVESAKGCWEALGELSNPPYTLTKGESDLASNYSSEGLLQ
jgi:hypothetical protein